VTRLRIRGGRIIDPANGVDRDGDLCVAEGRIVAIGATPDGFTPKREIDATGCVVCPGLVDLAARLREPGAEHKASIASEARAAAAAGITTVVCPPDTDPPVDTPAVVELIHQRAAAADQARVEVLGALTHGLRGAQLAAMGALAEAGCVGVSNAHQPIRDTEVLRRALEYAATLGLTVFLHAEDPWLAEGRMVHEGAVSARLGLAGIPAVAETVAVARILMLAEASGARVHFCRLSTAAAVDQLGAAQAHGLPVSADVAAHQLHLTEDAIDGFDSLAHVRPPLRTAADREALRSGLAAGVITAVCSDHQPHEADAKLNPFPETEPGISALETLLPLTLALVRDGALTLPRAIDRLTQGPAVALGLARGTLAPGAPADVCVFDPETRYALTESDLLSAGKNSPFIGRELGGSAVVTLVEGRVVFEGRGGI